jgi:hypothetical protein
MVLVSGSESARRFVVSALALAALLVFAIGCGRAGRDSAAPAPPPATPASAASVEDGIPWFEGSVEAAFELAKRERRPVFLYWGAVWCPPCHALRARIFPRPEIRARLAAAVPVYLDGDTERAQIWGEKLGTQGYPTVIVFDADGREITRLPSLLPVEEYADLLASALDAARPISDVLAAAEAEGVAALPDAELQLLAFYSWDQDSALGLDAARRRALFARFRSELGPDRKLERARFLALELAALAELEPAPALSTAERTGLASGVTALLADPATRGTNLDLLVYRAGAVVTRLAPEAGSERDTLVAAWSAAAREVEADESFTLDDRLSALAPQLELATLPSASGEPPAVPEELRERVRERVRWAGGEVRDEDEMQAVMDTMAGLLLEAGLVDEAKSLLSEKLAETTAPYYYVGFLASLEARSGRATEAVALYRDAWQRARAATSGAGMTPFRWGSSYLRQAMKLTPEAEAAIAADSRAVLAELLGSPDAFAGGNWGRLTGLATAFEEWRAGDESGRGAIVDAARDEVAAACGALADAGPDSPGGRCRSFLAPHGAG